MGVDDREWSWDKPKRKNDSQLFVQIALGLFLGLFALWFAVQKYYEHQAQRAIESVNQMIQQMNHEAEINAQQIELQNQQRMAAIQQRERLNNTWVDMGNGGYINVGQVQRKGDITTVLIRNNDGITSMDINCGRGAFYSEMLKAWHRPVDQNSISGRAIQLVCH